MKKVHRRRVRRNPTGTLLVNPGGGRRKRTRGKRGSLAGFLKSIRRRVRNPLMANPRRRRVKVRAHTRRRNPLMANPRHRRHLKRSRRHSRRHNPLMANPRHRRSRRVKVRAHTRRRNPIHIRRRRNPSRIVSGASRMASGFQRKAQGMLGKLPLVGGVLAGAVGVLGTSLSGALGVYPVTYIMPRVAGYVPSWLKPFAYTAVGAVAAGLLKAFPDRWIKIPYKSYIATSVAAAGGALDAYRYRMGQSMSLGSLMLAGPEDIGGMDDFGDIGEVGNDGSPRACHEYAGTDLGDADYSGDDLSDAELAAAELGRKHYWQRFRAGRRGGPSEDGASDYAGKPGLRHGWLIYWIGFDSFQRLAQMAPAKRQELIRQMKTEAKMRARKLLQEGADTTIEQAEMAGLLAS